MGEENEESGEYGLDETLIEFAKLPLEERIKFFEDIYARVASKNKLKTMKVFFQDNENGIPKVVGIEDKNA